MAAMLIFIKLQLNQLPLASDLDLSTKTLVVRQTYSLGDAVIEFYCLSDDSQKLFRRLITGQSFKFKLFETRSDNKDSYGKVICLLYTTVDFLVMNGKVIEK